MKPKRIIQLTAGFSYGDAISDYALKLKHVIDIWGIDNGIYSVPKHVGPKVRHQCGDYADLEINPKEDVIIYHFSIGSELTPFFIGQKAKKVILYHNITPPVYFRFINEEKAHVLEEGLKELPKLAGTADLNLGVSRFNAQCLEEHGFKDVGVLPLIFDPADFSAAPKQQTIHQYKGEPTEKFLCIGRVAPNKRIEDVLMVYHLYNRLYNPHTRLFIVGSYIGTERYYEFLRATVASRDIKNVTFTGHVSFDDMLAFYTLADTYLCMSEHEGFCLPLLEASYFDCPVVAFASAAIPETMAGTGIVINGKDHRLYAAACAKLRQDRDFRKAVIATQKKRLPAFSYEAAGKRFKEIIESL